MASPVSVDINHDENPPCCRNQHKGHPSVFPPVPFIWTASPLDHHLVGERRNGSDIELNLELLIIYP